MSDISKSICQHATSHAPIPFPNFFAVGNFNCQYARCWKTLLMSERQWKLINIVFIVAKLGNIWLRTQNLYPGNKNVFDLRQKQFLYPSSKICFRNICFPRG